MMRVQDLSGALLDYWVARAEGRLDHFETYISDGVAMLRTERYEIPGYGFRDTYSTFAPSTDWAVGEPIIEREHIAIMASEWTDNRGEEAVPLEKRWTSVIGAFEDYIDDRLPGFSGYGKVGPTPLIAAMRAFVASKFGEEVPEVPDA